MIVQPTSLAILVHQNWTSSTQRIGKMSNASDIFNTYTTKKIVKTYQMRNLNDLDEDNVAQIASDIDWSRIYNQDNVNDKMLEFYKIMNETMNKICPLKTLSSRHTPVPWMTSAIRELMNKRKFYYDLWKMKRKDESADMLYATYKRLDNETKHMIRDSKKGGQDITRKMEFDS